ncbi:hypothetical protein BJF78_32095 [Pseudonocardia sp. CNS-139]|nr:hypothetical protein BJF78_32095 [Pseudonocardia sp. CNS-139]
MTSAQSAVRSAELTAQANLTPRTADQIAQAKASVDAAQVQVDIAQRELDETTLTAPMGGVVLTVNGAVGDTAGSSGGGASGTTGETSESSSGTESGAFITIANASRMAVTADIPEADAGRLELGQRAEVTFPATGATATGTVTGITPESTVENNVVFYPVTVSLDTAPPDVGVGATSGIAIDVGSVTGVLTVPSTAVTTVGDSSTVTVRRDGADTVVPVQVGMVGDTTTEITSGVAEGDVVVLPSPTAATGGTGLPPSGGGLQLRPGGGR